MRRTGLCSVASAPPSLPGPAVHKLLPPHERARGERPEARGRVRFVVRMVCPEAEWAAGLGLGGRGCAREPTALHGSMAGGVLA